MGYKFKSLKLYATIIFFVTFVNMAYDKILVSGDFTILLVALMGYYFGANVVSKFAPKISDFLKKVGIKKKD